jgi:hypothetical protein
MRDDGGRVDMLGLPVKVPNLRHQQRVFNLSMVSRRVTLGVVGNNMNSVRNL